MFGKLKDQINPSQLVGMIGGKEKLYKMVANLFVQLEPRMSEGIESKTAELEDNLEYGYLVLSVEKNGVKKVIVSEVSVEFIDDNPVINSTIIQQSFPKFVNGLIEKMDNGEK